MTMKKIGMKKSPAEEIELFLHRMISDSGINRQSGQEGADDVRQVDEIGEFASHRHYAQHRDKIARLIVPQLVQNPGQQAAAMRLVNEAVPLVQLRQRTEQVARKLMEKNPHILSTMKLTYRRVKEMNWDAAEDYLYAKAQEAYSTDPEEGRKQGMQRPRLQNLYRICWTDGERTRRAAKVSRLLRSEMGQNEKPPLSGLCQLPPAADKKCHKSQVMRRNLTCFDAHCAS